MDALLKLYYYLSWLTVPLAATVGIIILSIAYHVYQFKRTLKPVRTFPVATLMGLTPLTSFMKHGRQTVEEAMRKFSGPFQVITPAGPTVILPSQYAKEIGFHSSFSFHDAIPLGVTAKYPGFEPLQISLKQDPFLRDLVQIKLTRFLDLVTGGIVDETAATLSEVLGDSDQWRSVKLYPALHLVTLRVTSRVLLGDKLCRDARWLEIADGYPNTYFKALAKLRLIPWPIKSLVYWLIPECTTIRHMVQDSRRLIDPEVKTRKKAVDRDRARRKLSGTRARHAQGSDAPQDGMTWLYELAVEQKLPEPDYASLLIGLTMAASSPTVVTVQLLVHLCEFPEIIPQLRKEIIEVVGKLGWSRKALYELKLMDSFMRESQRYTPQQLTSIRRSVTQDVALSGGLSLKKGDRIKVCTTVHDEKIYPEPTKFDPARFLRLREGQTDEKHEQTDSFESNSNMWQFSASNPDWMLFSYGTNACPGRFMASVEIKIALCHLIMQYDWRFAENHANGSLDAEKVEAKHDVGGTKIAAEHIVEFRRRAEEINLGVY